jgi:hypothetical protein
MADISMCKGEGCHRKRECYRFTAKPNEFRQAYFHPSAPWYIGPDNKQACQYFTPNSDDPVSLSQTE